MPGKKKPDDNTTIATAIEFAALNLPRGWKVSLEIEKFTLVASLTEPDAEDDEGYIGIRIGCVDVNEMASIIKGFTIYASQ